MTLSAMGAGRLDRGVAAFMDPNWSAVPSGVFNQGIDGPGTEEVAARTAANNRPLMQFLASRGYDLSGVDPTRMIEMTRGRQQFAQLAGTNRLGEAFGRADTDLQDYYRLRGGSAGWDGRNNMRGIATTLYHNDNNVWSPVSAPQFSVQPRNPGWLRGEGSEFVAAASMMLPMVGGWAGLFNSVAPSLSTSLSSAIGQTAANGLINSAANSLLSGNLGGMISGLGGAAGGALGQGLGTFGSQIGSMLGRRLASSARR